MNSEHRLAIITTQGLSRARSTNLYVNSRLRSYIMRNLVIYIGQGTKTKKKKKKKWKEKKNKQAFVWETFRKKIV